MLEKGYDRFQQLLSQLEAHSAKVSTEDANHKFIRSLPPDGKPRCSKKSSSAQNVAFVSQIKSSTTKVKSGFTGAYSTCTPSTSTTNIPEKEVLVGSLNAFNCLNTVTLLGMYSKGTHDGKKKGGENILKLKRRQKNHALMAISSSRSIGTSFVHSVDFESEISSVPQEVSRVNTVTTNVNTVRSRPPVPTRTSNNFSPKRPQVNQFNQRRHFSKSYSSVRRPFAKTVAHSHAVKGNWGSAVKTSAGYNWRNSKPNSNCDSGPTFIRTVNAKGPQGRPKPVKAWGQTGNKDQLEDLKNSMGDLLPLEVAKATYLHKVLFTETECLVVSSDFKMHDENQITSKGAGTSQTQNSNASEEKDEDVELIVVPSAVKNTEEKVESRTSSTNSKKQENKASSTDTSEDNPKILALRRELEEIALKAFKGTDIWKITLPLEIFHKSETGIFDEASYDEEGVITDFNSLPTEIEVSPTPTLRIHNIHPKSQILGDPKSAVLTRSKMQQKSGAHALFSYIQNQQRNNYKDQQHYLNKRYKRGVVVRNKKDSWAQGYTQEEGMTNEEVFAHCGHRIEAFSTSYFLAFALFMGFIVYQMDVKSAFLYGTIDEEVYVSQPPGFVDPDHPKKVYKVVKALYGLHQAPRAWYATLSTFLEKHRYKRGTIDKTLFIKKDKKDIMLVQVSIGELFFFGLQVKQNKTGIFISQDKYVAEILKKFDLVNVKTAITPIETKVALTKDEEAVDVDVHLYRSMIGHSQDFTYNAMKRIFRTFKATTFGIWYHRDSPFDLDAFLKQKQTLVATSTTEAEYVAAANCCGQVLWVQNQLLDYGFNFMNTKIHIDNESTICIVKNPVYHSKTCSSEIRPRFAEIVDFLRGSNLRYALTTNPTIYDSLVKQFWQTATANTLADGTLELHATIDTIVYTITEASIRNKLQLADASGITMLPNNEIFEGMGHMGVKTLEVALKRKTKRVLLSDSEEEETEAQGRKFHDLDPLVSLLQELVTPSKTHSNTVNASGEEQVEDISPTTLEVAAILTKVKKINSAFDEVKYGSIKVSTGIESINAGSFDVNYLAVRMLRKKLWKGRSGKKVHLDSLIAQRMAEEQELTEQQKKRKAQVQFEAQSYTEEKWDTNFIARKGLHTDLDKDDSEDSDEASKKDDSTSGIKIPINPVPVAIKSPSIASYKIIKQGRKVLSPDCKENGSDRKHGMNEPEDEFEKVLWEYLKNMFEEPLSTDSIWSLPERKYLLSAEVCKAMLDKKFQGEKPDEDCYKLLKMMEKQAGIRKK
ncbi:putative ribonuclease H-like domain-containing protein [Tanacetum coccineum]